MSQNVKQLEFERSILDTSKLRTTVRFSSDEYIKIKSDSEIFNRSLPALLKTNYFKRLPTSILMTPEKFKIFYRIYSGVANNLNQITKKAHLGFSIPEKTILEFVKSNDELFHLVNGLNGHR